MIVSENGIVEMEEGEQNFRSCWKCNPSHERLKKVNTLHQCFDCGRYWIYDRLFEEFGDKDNFDNEAWNKYFCEEMGLNPGDSTTKIDLWK